MLACVLEYCCPAIAGLGETLSCVEHKKPMIIGTADSHILNRFHLANKQ